jgi:serine/threonine protein kinase
MDYWAPELVQNYLDAHHCHTERQSGRPVEGGVTKYGVGVDMWALGCVIYEMLCGVPPFFSDDDATQLALIKRHKLLFPDDTAQVGSRIVSQARES